MEGEQSGNGGIITNLILTAHVKICNQVFVIKMTRKLASFIIAIQRAMNKNIILSFQVMYYLSELAGGATAFPILGVAATPKPGTAVFW